MSRCFEIGGTEFEFDEEQMGMLNNLAERFYNDMGYSPKNKIDYASSQHPQEQKMFILAVRAYEYHMEVGFD